MQQNRLKKITIFLLGLGLTGLYAQENVNATAGSASGSGGSASYSMGQVACKTHSGTNGIVTEGVQQPYEIIVVTAIQEAKGISLSVYPNPANEDLTLSIDAFDISNLSYQLYDMQGKLLQSEKITGNQINIAMSHFMPANYIVKITQNNNDIKTFKIIKK